MSLSMKSATVRALALICLVAVGQPAAACPNPAAAFNVTRSDARGLAEGVRQQVSINAPHDLRACPQPGTGFVSMFPELVLELSDNPGRQRLVMSLPGDCDATLLVRDPASAWHFAEWIPNAPVTLGFDAAAPGDWVIFVGLTRQSHCRTTLSVRMEGGATAGRPPVLSKPRRP